MGRSQAEVTLRSWHLNCRRSHLPSQPHLRHLPPALRMTQQQRERIYVTSGVQPSCLETTPQAQGTDADTVHAGHARHPPVLWGRGCLLEKDPPCAFQSKTQKREGGEVATARCVQNLSSLEDRTSNFLTSGRRKGVCRGVLGEEGR